MTRAEILAQIPDARARERQDARDGLRANKARYQRSTDRLLLELTNGVTFTFPTQRIASRMRPHLRCSGLAPVIAAASVVATALATAPSAANAQASPTALIQRAVTSIGGEAALRGLTNTTVDFNSTAFGIGQEETPLSPARATLSFGRITTDYRGMRRATTQELRATRGAVTRQRRVLAGGIGMTESNGVATPDAPAAANAAVADIRLLPDRLLLAALETPAALTLVRPRPVRGEMMDGLRYANGPDTLSLWFDRLNGRLVMAERITDDGVLGDRRNTVMYTRWADAGGVLLPREIDSEANGRLVAHTVITAASINNAALADSMFAISDSVAQRARRLPPPSTSIPVTLVDIGPDVWRAEGQSHHSLVVKQGSELLVIEMPQTSARSRAVLDTLRSRFPGVPVRRAVNTHHHWDHSGGVREYLSRGITVVTHRRNVSFLQGIAASKKTVATDALSRGGKPGLVRAATDTMFVGDGDTRVMLLELPNTHVEGMLVAYVPALRVLFVADVIQPGPTMSPAGSREVMAMVKAHGITVDRVVGAHAGIVPWADVVAAAGR